MHNHPHLTTKWFGFTGPQVVVSSAAWDFGPSTFPSGSAMDEVANDVRMELAPHAKP